MAQDFVGPLLDSNRTIKGFAGSRTNNVKVGTLVWKWADDEGKVSKFIIPNSYYVPEGRVRLLSPQHWAKSQERRQRKKDRTYGIISQTNSENVTLMWNNRKSKLTVPLGEENNVATFYLASGYSRYKEFCLEAKIDDDEVIIGNDTPMAIEQTIAQKGIWSKDIHAKFLDGPSDQSMERTEISEFDLPNISEDDGNHHGVTEPADGLLKMHYRFGHISFRKLQYLARQGVIPKRYATCPIPICAACMYGKMIRRQWRHKTSNEYESLSHGAKAPGDLVAVDQMVSPTPGFIAQITGKLTAQQTKSPVNILYSYVICVYELLNFLYTYSTI